MKIGVDIVYGLFSWVELLTITSGQLDEDKMNLEGQRRKLERKKVDAVI